MNMNACQIMELQGFARSSKWPKVRDQHLELEPACRVCGATKNLNVHHIRPYHLYPSLELDFDNLITLCEGGPVNCHFLFGHLLNWASYNRHVVNDADDWFKKIASRPNTSTRELVRFMPDDDQPTEPSHASPTNETSGG